MASKDELNRMIYNVEGAITRVMNSIKRIESPFCGEGDQYCPHTGIHKQFLKLKRIHSLLIEISTKLQKQNFEAYQNEIRKRKEN